MRVPYHYIIILLILDLLFFNTSFAQQFNRHYNFKQLSVENGLANNIVYHFLQDDQGYIWIGTRNGITWYDGSRTYNFQHDDLDKKSISGNFITQILQDSGHHIWIGTNAGIDLFDRSDNSFTHFSITLSNGKQEDTYCVPLGFSKNTDLWLIDTRNKAIKIFNINTKEFKTILTTNAVDGSMYYSKKDRIIHIWTYLSIGTIHYEFRDHLPVKTEFYFDHQKNTSNPSLHIFHVFYNGSSAAWLSTAKGLIELNTNNHKYKLYHTTDYDPVQNLRCAAIAPNGLLWVGTGGQGIFSFDTASKKFLEHFSNYISDPNSICSNNIVSMYFDKTGNIWCGSYGNGISYANVETRTFAKFLSKSELEKWGKNNNVFWLGTDKRENIWCILQDVPGLFLLDSSLKIKKYQIPLYKNGKDFKGAIYQMFFDNTSKPWLITDIGLFQYDPISNFINQVQYHKISNSLFGSYWVNYMISLHNHSLLFSTFAGLYRISKNNQDNLVIRPFSDLNSNKLNSFEMLYEDKEKNIYVKDIGDSLFILGQTNNSDQYKVNKRIKFQDRLIQFTENDSSILIGTSQGLYIIHKKNFRLEKSPLNAIFPFTNINNIFLNNNSIWLLGDKGLFCYNSSEKSSRLFTVEDGLVSNNFSKTGIALTKSGKYIAGTYNGLAVFDPNTIKDNIYPPRAQLIRFCVNDSITNFIVNPQNKSSISLLHNQNTFSIYFSSIGFQHISSCSYEYKLEGYDEGWIKSGGVQYIRYSKIPPGIYHFQLRVIDVNGNTSPYSKTLSIEIKKAFWETNIFKFLIAVLIISLIWMLIKWYLTIKLKRQQRLFEEQQAIERERTRIATDMHDDLGAGLSSLRFLSEKVKRNTFSEVSKSDIDKILSTSSELIDKMNEIVWAMNEKNDSLEDLLTYMRSYAKEYCEDNGIACEINMPENIPSIFVSGEIRRNVFLTIKECLHNIVKHAKASKTEIGFTIGPNLFIFIKDDGKGFGNKDGSNYDAGNGLKNMRKRIESIGGNFTIYENTGIVVELEVPLLL